MRTTASLTSQEPRKPVARTFFAISFLTLGVLSIWQFKGQALKNAISSISWLRITEIKLDAEKPLRSESLLSELPNIKGENIWLLDSQSIAAAIENKEWVRSVTVRKEFPNRLAIHVSADQPVAIFSGKRGLTYLDADGNRISDVKRTDAKWALPILSVETRVALEGWVLRKILAMPELFHSRTGFEVSELVLSTYPFFKVYLTSPKMAILMNFENWEHQLTSLNQLLRHPPKEIGAFHSIHIVTPKKAVVRAGFSN